MSTAVQTQQIETSDTSGSPIALAYGYVWATGKRLAYFMLQNTGNSTLDYTRVGAWALGRGEWDGCIELWINDVLVWQSETADSTQFHFHRGADAVIGSGLVPNSMGPDQGCDAFWASFPSAVQPLCYNGIAYYMIKRKQPIIDSTLKENDATQWTDIAPIGLWRARRCRLFDANGNQTGYAFTTNPAWQIVDAILARKVKPDYNIDLANGPTQLTAAESARFNWPSFAAAATYYDQFLANGRRRFTFSGYFASTATLNAVLEPILLSCRSYLQETAGQIYLRCDQPRASIFTFTRAHNITLQPNDKSLHSAPNRLVGKFRDLLIPQAAQIVSIVPGVASTLTNTTAPIVTTADVHPFVAGDNIIIGGTNSTYDGPWVVLSVPSTVDVSGNPDPTTLALTPTATTIFPTVGAGGSIGLTYSRFKDRNPEFPHKRNQLARGAIGVGIPRQRNMIKQEYDLSVASWDQVSRVMQYERDRMLGPDVDPYITPTSLTLKAPLFAADAAGNLASGIEPGDVVTIDSTANVPYAGQYEVQPLTLRPVTAQASGSGNSLALTPAPDGGEIELELQAFSASYMYDSSLDTQAGWNDVPGSDPGGGETDTITTTDSAFVFLSGVLPSGGSFQLPSGINQANSLSWASPQGFLGLTMPGAWDGPAGYVPGVGFYPMQYIQSCEVDSALRCLLQYTNGGYTSQTMSKNQTWGGPVGYFCFAWRNSSSVTVTTIGTMTYVSFTLPNGEKICFGQGIIADGASFALPAGFTSDKMFAIAMIHDGNANGTRAAGAVTASITGMTVALRYTNNSTSWGGNASVLVFAWQNNSGQVTVDNVAGGSWIIVPDGTQGTLGVGLVRVSDGGSLPLPAAAAGSVLQAIASPRSNLSTGSNQCPGIASCFVDSVDVVHCQFAQQDNTGIAQANVSGDAMIFGLFVAATPATGTVTPAVTISPTTASVVETYGYQQFSAAVVGESVTTVSWSVDGIAGGSATVGTVDAIGLYTAPIAAGTHTVTATSTALSTLSASAIVTVFAYSGIHAVPGPRGILTQSAG